MYQLLSVTTLNNNFKSECIECDTLCQINKMTNKMLPWTLTVSLMTGFTANRMVQKCFVESSILAKVNSLQFTKWTDLMTVATVKRLSISSGLVLLI